MDPFDLIGKRIQDLSDLYDNDGPSATVPESRNSFSGGGLALARMLLKNLNKTGPIKGLEEKLIKKYKSEGMDLLEAIQKAQTEKTVLKNKSKNKILDDAMKETNITSDDYVELIDEKIKIIEPEYYTDIKRWNDSRPDLADKTRALFFPDWAEAKYGENYVGVLQNKQAKAIRENIDPNVKEPLSPTDQMVSNIDDMNTANINEFFDGRKKNAEGGFQQLVQPNANGSRPGYQGTKKGVKEKTTVVEGNKLANDFNKLVVEHFDKGDMSKTPTWKSFLESKKLKHATSGYYRTNASTFNVIDSRLKKFELADRLIAEASEGFKFVPWMDIQRKLTLSKGIDTNTWRSYIDQNNQINGQAAKVSKTFDYLLDNDIELNKPKKLSKTMKAEGSILRKVIADLTGAGKAGIVEGLNMILITKT